MRKTSKDYYRSAKRAYLEYQDSIFPTELDFLHHLFFVNGNGYDWEDGALVREYWETKKQREEHRQKINADWLEKFRKIYYTGPKISLKEWRKATTAGDRHLYPLCKYARCLNIPDNIRPDWLKALRRALEWAEITEHHEWLDKNYRSYDPPKTNEEEDHKFLAIAWTRLKELESETNNSL